MNVRPLVQIVHVSDVSSDGAVSPYAFASFARFTTSLTVGDPTWRKHPAWFVASQLPRGARALDALEALAPRTAFRARVALCGPHDSRAPRHAPVLWPAPPLTERSPDARTEVQLYALDTHDGVVDAPSFARLGGLMAQHRNDARTTAVRVVVSHHPVPALLCERAPDVTGPLAHLHLAAHTPRIEPEVARASPAFISPGSFSRAERPWSGTATVLRLYAAMAQSGVVVCERFVAARSAASGEWRVRAEESGEIATEWILRG